MHYRNGREAKNGDKIVQIGPSGAQIVAVGTLSNVGDDDNDYCDGRIAPVDPPVVKAYLCDCLHVEDIADMLKANGLAKRPEGK